MIKAIALVGALALAAAFNVRANDSDRIDQMERDIQELKLRLSEIEASHSNPRKAQHLDMTSDGWKSLANWRQLSSGMSPTDVRRILGEPHRLDGGHVAYWHYKNQGKVIFVDDKIQSWREPQD